MKNIEIDDQTYQKLQEEAERLHLSEDTFLSTVLMGQIAEEREISQSISGIGLLTDDPKEVDMVLDYIMKTRSESWRTTDD